MKQALWVALLSALSSVGTCGGDLLADASGAAFEASRHSLEHELPTYWECETCLDCVPTAEASAGLPAAKTSWGVPACSRCTGCTHELELLNLSARVRLHSGDVRVIPMQPGNTGASIFRAVDAAGASHVPKARTSARAGRRCG